MKLNTKIINLSDFTFRGGKTSTLSSKELIKLSNAQFFIPYIEKGQFNPNALILDIADSLKLISSPIVREGLATLLCSIIEDQNKNKSKLHQLILVPDKRQEIIRVLNHYRHGQNIEYTTHRTNYLTEVEKLNAESFENLFNLSIPSAITKTDSNQHSLKLAQFIEMRKDLKKLQALNGKTDGVNHLEPGYLHKIYNTIIPKNNGHLQKILKYLRYQNDIKDNIALPLYNEIIALAKENNIEINAEFSSPPTVKRIQSLNDKIKDKNELTLEKINSIRYVFKNTLENIAPRKLKILFENPNEEYLIPKENIESLRAFQQLSVENQEIIRQQLQESPFKVFLSQPDLYVKRLKNGLIQEKDNLDLLRDVAPTEYILLKKEFKEHPSKFIGDITDHIRMRFVVKTYNDEYKLVKLILGKYREKLLEMYNNYNASSISHHRAINMIIRLMNSSCAEIQTMTEASYVAEEILDHDFLYKNYYELPKNIVKEDSALYKLIAGICWCLHGEDMHHYIDSLIE